MAHMQPQITEKMRGWRVETKDAGTCYVPEDVVAIPHILASATPMKRDGDWLNQAIFDKAKDALAEYVEGRIIEEIEVVGPCYFVRLSAPGYLDCTEWNFANTLRDVKERVRELLE